MLTSPKAQRRTKGHVASACMPCKRAHLRYVRKSAMTTSDVAADTSVIDVIVSFFFFFFFFSFLQLL